MKVSNHNREDLQVIFGCRQFYRIVHEISNQIMGEMISNSISVSWDGC